MKTRDIIMLKTVFNPEVGSITKLVPNQDKDGVLDPRAREEIVASNKRQPTEEAKNIPLVEQIRASMGWPASKDISTHEIIVEDDKTKYGVAFRTYVKKDLVDKTLPVVFFYHGGGFFGGSIDAVDNPARAVADLADVLVISVDWALAPENPAPMGLIESYQTMLWVLRDSDLRIDKQQVAVMGDSAGGNLAYALSLLDKAFGTNVITKIVSFYPVTYLGHDTNLLSQLHDSSKYDIEPADKELLVQYVQGFEGGTELIDNWYLQESNPEVAFLSPLLADEQVLSQLPSSLMIIGEFDPLRFEGEALWEKIKAAGGDVTYIRYNGMIHAFMDKVGDFEQADDAMQEVANFLKK